MLVRDWMTRNVVTVTPETSILNARRLLDTYEVRHLPVVADDQVVGMVSSRDIRCGDRTLNAALAALRSDLADGRFRPVSSIASMPARTIPPDATIAAASELMLAQRIGALPVVDGDRLVGIISLLDCLRAYLAREAEHERRARAHPAAEDDPDLWMRLPVPPGDRRPGRSGRPRPVDDDDTAASVVPPERTPGRKAG